MTVDRAVHPRHGTHEPVTATPDRRPGSVRRTTTFDMLRPDGVRKELVLVGRARDVATSLDGTATPLAEATLDVVIDYLDACRVREIRSTPPLPGLAALVGVSAATGFRAAADAAVDVAAAKATPLYQLVDDVPVATLVSGYAVGFAVRTFGAGSGSPFAEMRRAEGMAALQVADLCAGFQTGGTIMQAQEETGASPLVTGPLTPSVERPDDPWACHELAILPFDAMRRRRRIDVAPGERDGTVEVDAHFRDSHMGPDGLETTVHEYLVRAVVDLGAGTFVAARAEPRVLPWYECPQAAASAARLVGRPLATLRPSVRADFVGPTTCTHLNDTFRALEDVPSLAAAGVRVGTRHGEGTEPSMVPPFQRGGFR